MTRRKSPNPIGRPPDDYEPMTFRERVYFVSLLTYLEHGTLKKAADALGYSSKNRVRYHIGQLEEIHGPLLVRENRYRQGILPELNDKGLEVVDVFLGLADPELPPYIVKQNEAKDAAARTRRIQYVTARGSGDFMVIEADKFNEGGERRIRFIAWPPRARQGLAARKVHDG